MKIIVPASLAVALLATPSRAALPADVAAMMDTSVDPCDDFYQYACGTWVKNFTLASDENYHYNSYTGLAKRNQAQIEAIVQGNQPLIGELWDSCMAIDTMTARGAAPVQRDLARIALAGTKRDLFKLAGGFAVGNNGPALFTNSNVMTDGHNATNTVLNTGSPSLVLPDWSYYLDNATFAGIEAPFRTYIATITKLAGIQETPSGQQQQQQASYRTNSTKRIEDIVIHMETVLAQARPTDDELTNYYSLSYSDAAATYPLTFGAMTQGMGLLQKSTATPHSVMTFDSLPFMDRIETALTALKLDDLKLYYKFLYVHTYAEQLGEPFVNAKFALLSTALQGVPSRPPRTKECTDSLIAQLPDLIGQYYAQQAFDAARQRSAQLLVDAIEKTMGDHIAGLPWLDAPTRAQALAKLAKVSNLLGVPTQNRTYPFELVRDNFFDNVQKIQASEWTRAVAKVAKPFDRTDWGSVSPATANSFYSWFTNQMIFPAATLQPPFFSGTVHPVQNFGAIGAVIGHELTHGFDSDGRRFDGDGNRFNWWSDASAAAFEARAQCMRDQYSAFTTSVGKVNGNHTITENIADNGGLSLAYDAYHAWAKTAPAFDTHGVRDDEVDQLFYVASGQVFCHKIRDELQKQWLVTNVHAPGKWRVNGPAMNHAPFAKTFQCKSGSKMNPINKCEVW